MFKKNLIVIIFSLCLYVFTINNKINIMKHNIERDKEIVCIMFERQVFILENQSLLLNKYVDDVLLTDVKLSLLTLKNLCNENRLNYRDFDIVFGRTLEGIIGLQKYNEELKSLIDDFQIKIDGCYNRLSIAKKDYAISVNNYNKYINSFWCKPYKLLFGCREVKNMYVKNYTNEDIQNFNIVFGGDIFDEAYNFIFTYDN